MLYYAGVGEEKKDQEKKKKKSGRPSNFSFLIEERKDRRVNGCSGFSLSLYDEFVIKISRTSRNFILYFLSLVSLLLVTEQNKRVIMQYTYQILVCDVLQYTHQCPTR